MKTKKRLDKVSVIFLQFVLKTVYEIILLPVTTWVIRKLKQYEGEDTYDRDINYGIFEVFKRRQAES